MKFILKQWIDASLLKEFRRSCDFTVPTEDTGSPENSSNTPRAVGDKEDNRTHDDRSHNDTNPHEMNQNQNTSSGFLSNHLASAVTTNDKDQSDADDEEDDDVKVIDTTDGMLSFLENRGGTWNREIPLITQLANFKEPYREKCPEEVELDSEESRKKAELDAFCHHIFQSDEKFKGTLGDEARSYFHPELLVREQSSLPQHQYHADTNNTSRVGSRSSSCSSMDMKPPVPSASRSHPRTSSYSSMDAKSSSHHFGSLSLKTQISVSSMGSTHNTSSLLGPCYESSGSGGTGGGVAMPSGNLSTTSKSMHSTLFRGDFVETLLVTYVINRIKYKYDQIFLLASFVVIRSFVKCVAQTSGLLTTWLLPTLLAIASDPESCLSIATHSSQHSSQQPSPMALADPSTARDDGASYRKPPPNRDSDQFVSRVASIPHVFSDEALVQNDIVQKKESSEQLEDIWRKVSGTGKSPRAPPSAAATAVFSTPPDARRASLLSRFFMRDDASNESVNGAAHGVNRHQTSSEAVHPLVELKSKVARSIGSRTVGSEGTATTSKTDTEDMNSVGGKDVVSNTSSNEMDAVEENGNVPTEVIPGVDGAFSADPETLLTLGIGSASMDLLTPLLTECSSLSFSYDEYHRDEDHREGYDKGDHDHKVPEAKSAAEPVVDVSPKTVKGGSPVIGDSFRSLASSPVDYEHSTLALPLPPSSTSLPSGSVLAAASLLFQQMEATKTALPSGLRILMESLKALTIGAEEPTEGEAIPTSSSHGTNAFENTRAGKPEYGVFWVSSAALLMLRLVCPALTCPTAFGFVRGPERDKSNSASAASGGGASGLLRRVSGKSGADGSTTTTTTSAEHSPSTSILSPLSAVLERTTKLHAGNSSSTTTTSAGIAASSLDRSAAAMILISHSLLEGSTQMKKDAPKSIVWGGTDEELQTLLSAATEIVNQIPIQKVRLQLLRFCSLRITM